jgi:hypothetical protein
MSAPPYILNYTAEAEKVIDDLQSPQHRAKLKKLRKTLRLGDAHKIIIVTIGPPSVDQFTAYQESLTSGFIVGQRPKAASCPRIVHALLGRPRRLPVVLRSA